jgi:hypothetical protein
MDEKTCRVCGETKPATREFFPRNDCCRDGMAGTCKDCRNAMLRSRNAAHPGVKAAYGRTYYARHRTEIAERRAAKRLCLTPARARFREWRAQGCLVCGESDWRVIDAHHVDVSEKEVGVGRATNLATVESELAKCVPLCANHHRLVHIELHDGHAGASLDEVIAYLKAARQLT